MEVSNLSTKMEGDCWAHDGGRSERRRSRRRRLGSVLIVMGYCLGWLLVVLVVLACFFIVWILCGYCVGSMTISELYLNQTIKNCVASVVTGSCGRYNNKLDLLSSLSAIRESQRMITVTCGMNEWLMVCVVCD